MIVGAVSGVCFAALAARSIGVLAITPHFRASSLVFAVVTFCLSYVAFRAATSGRTDEETFLRALAGGVGGALVALIIIGSSYVMFRQATRAYFAHPIGLHFSQVTMSRLVTAFLCLGFAAGFVLRMQTVRRR
jgi:uncharacterized membrane protein